MSKPIIQPLTDRSRAAKARIARLLARSAIGGNVDRRVDEILRSVARRGDRAVAEWTRRLDGVRLRPGRFALPDAALDAAVARVDRATLRALRAAHARIVRYHRCQRQGGFEIAEAGVRTGMRVTPLGRVGVYVPGGRAAYPSSVLMNVVPARVAGVDDITVVTPPSPDGIRPEVLAAARIAGATRVLTIGGAQAIAALAYGTESVARVDKIVGPGNRYVAAAKRMVFGHVDIDMIAGPSEVLIVADGRANAAWVAADMLAQAEHDPVAAAVCLTASRRLAERVAEEVAAQLATLPRRKTASSSIRRYGTIVVTDTLARAVELANEIAPEHLELFVSSPRRWLPAIRNAGAVFLGEATTESVGDYVAGPNHVLPTGGAARFASPLGVYDFVKRTSIIEVKAGAIDRLAPTVVELARCEGLEAHARAVLKRASRG